MTQIMNAYTTPFYKNIIDAPPSMVRKLWKKGENYYNRCKGPRGI